jgi:hypothetical protein
VGIVLLYMALSADYRNRVLTAEARVKATSDSPGKDHSTFIALRIVAA